MITTRQGMVLAFISGGFSPSFIDYFWASVIWILLTFLGVLLFIGLYYLWSMPLRRQERARLFLDLVETAIVSGGNVEETIVAISQSRERSVGARFHLLAAYLSCGLRLGEALDKVPRLLPPQIAAMLKVGEKTGDIAKVLPACRKILTDSVSQITKAQNYLVILAFVVTPMGMLIVPMLAVFVFPKFNAIFQDLGATAPVFMRLLIYWTPWVVGLQAVLFVLFYLGAFIYVGGPRVIGWLEAGLPRLSEWLFHRIPWRRKRMLRDFSAMLAILLDAAVPEPEAVTMAADCTANGVFRARAETATDDLCRGVKLTEAMRHLDDTGQFRWRLANAVRGQQDGFRTALAGWHEALDAKAFQEEQAVAHAVTTALVLCNGLMVCLVAVAVFQPLIAIVKEGLLW